MRTWIWQQPEGHKWNVETDAEKGTVKVFDQNNKLILEQKDMDEMSVKVIEDNFMSIVAEEVKDDKVVKVDSGLIVHDEPRIKSNPVETSTKKIYDGMMYA